MDIKGARLWYGCKMATVENIANVAFIRSKIQAINYFFDQQEIDEIWITFPDPQPRSSREKKRLTSPTFLERYREIAKNDAIIHLKTDDNPLYTYTLQHLKESGLSILCSTDDLYSAGQSDEAAKIQTFHEKIWLGQGLTIKYLKFKLFP